MYNIACTTEDYTINNIRKSRLRGVAAIENHILQLLKIVFVLHRQ